MNEKIDDLTIDYEENGIKLVKELDNYKIYEVVVER